MNSDLEHHRKIIIAANWKMNILPSESKALAIASTDTEWPEFIEVIICPPFTHLPLLQSLVADRIHLGAQNCHENQAGAFTGEISAPMIKDLHCDYVILGHSERREIQANENLESRILSAIHCGLKVIYCCGESISHREANTANEFIRMQLQHDLFNLPEEILKNIVIAYEPVWAIGTGKHAIPQEAQKMHAFIRAVLSEKFQVEDIEKLTLIYGGSVNSSNVDGFSGIPEIDGVLVGGASLKPQEFKSIIQSFAKNKM